MISKEEVKRIAELSRLDLSEKEIEKMQKDLSSILDYFDLLKNAPIIENSIKKVGDLRLARKDEILEKDVNVAEKIIAASPDKKDGYIKVKAIL
jgi:aspartyl-tRNA(Asn)/glutamyl-tRNA(Gln) amidotransferase subunit C